MLGTEGARQRIDGAVARLCTRGERDRGGGKESDRAGGAARSRW
jgi:hypothetical protein